MNTYDVQIKTFSNREDKFIDAGTIYVRAGTVAEARKKALIEAKQMMGAGQYRTGKVERRS